VRRVRTDRLALLRQLERNIAEHMPERFAMLAALRSLIVETEAEIARDAVLAVAEEADRA
jgi:hypothetical protein